MTEQAINPKGLAGNIPVYCAFDAIVSLEDMKPNPKNPNKHSEEQINLLAKVIDLQGWRVPVKVSNRSGYIVSGHGRYMAAQLLKCPVPVDYQDYANESDELADLLADNRIAELAEIDTSMLAEVFADIDLNSIETDVTGYAKDEISNILAAAVQPLNNAEEFDTEAALEDIKQPYTQEGDIWMLGRHRLMCGDSTNSEVVEKLLDGKTADLLLTDPPYNVSYTGKTADALTIENDNMNDDEFRSFLRDAFEAADNVLKPGGAFYIWHADSEGFNFRGACRDVKWKVRQCLIWVKNTMVLGRQDYQWKHEPCLYGWKDGAAHYWGSDRKQTTTLNFDKPLRNAEHPTMKPVSLFEYQIINSTESEERVLDLFGGSGTTLIACEQSGRTAYTLELDPKYCDVIVKRYVDTTGKRDVILTRDGVQIPIEDTEILTT